MDPDQTHNPYDGLEKLFHEPKRMAITSALCANSDGKSFNELKQECDLTDGNLNRHLKTLEDAGAIVLVKSAGKSRETRAMLTRIGRESFYDYLQALESALSRAVNALERDAETLNQPGFGHGLSRI